MFPLFTKPLNQLTWADVEKLVEAKATENQTIEFKIDLQVEDGSIHPWHERAGKIDAYTRDEILKEIVAFANADGGSLVLGMAESNDHEKRATKPKPLPRCKKLADRLRQLSENWIEPPLPVIEWRGILQGEGEDSGIVLARVPASRLAPHRVKENREFYVRRGDNSVPMTISEIRDSVLRSASMYEVLDERFKLRRWAALEKMRKIQHPGGWCVYIGVIPTAGSVRIERPYRYEKLFPRHKEFSAAIGTDKCILNFPSALGGISISRIQPILGGGRQEFRHSERDSFIVREVHDDALVELLFKFQPPHGSKIPNVYLNWVLALVANTLLTADEARKLAGAPSAELAVELTLCTNGQGRIVSPSDLEGSALEQWEVTLPRYIVGGPETIPDVLKDIMNGLLESSHQQAIDDFSIDLG